MNISRGLCVLVLAAGVYACSSAESDWKQAEAQGTVAAYQKFLNDHPTGSHVDQARSKIQSLQDEQAWADAQKANTADAYGQYVDSQPNGAHAAEARERKTGLERAAAWKVAEADGKAPALQQFLQKYPQGAESDEARAQLQKLEGYRVQLGAFRAKKEADSLRKRLQAHYANVLHDVVVVAPTPPDKLSRVRSAAMTQQEAQSACATLRKAHQHCEVVKG